MTAQGRGARVSVVIPTYRRMPLLLEAIRSVLTQSEPALEILVVDEHSDDGTTEAMRSFGDPVRLLSQERRGVAEARNVGIREARGSLVAFLDSDDTWHPDKLAVQLESLAAAPDAPFSFTDAQQVSQGGIVADSMMGQLGRGRGCRASFLDLVFGGNYVFTSTVVARREVLESVGGFDPDLPGSEDYDLWLRLAALGRPDYVDRSLASYRVHERKLSRLPDRLCVGEIAVLKKFERNFPEVVRGHRGRFRRRVASTWFRFGREDLREEDLSAARTKFLHAWAKDPTFLRAAGYAMITLPGCRVLRRLRGAVRGRAPGVESR